MAAADTLYEVMTLMVKKGPLSGRKLDDGGAKRGKPSELE